MLPPSDDPRIEAALARNERYVRQFVESFHLCPYARRCRETHKLHRTVLLDEGGPAGTAGFEAAAAALAGAIERIERLPPDSIEVALIVLPALVPALSRGLEAARAFDKLVAEARERMQARHPVGEIPFYCVPFHPDFAEDLTDAHRAVRFIRRSPDPTVQLVRTSVLRAVRGADPGGSRLVDAAKLSASELLVLGTPLSVSDRIAHANLRTLNDAGPDRLRALLAEIRTQARGDES